MIVVDTSVWIDVLNENATPQAERCVQLIEDGEPVALTEVILTEILQGLRSDEEAGLVETIARLPDPAPRRPGGLRPRG